MPYLDMRADDAPFAEEGAVLFGQQPTEKEKDVIPGNTIFRRIMRIYKGQDVVPLILSMKAADGVFLRALLDVRTHNKGVGNSPHTYDPRLDYKTDP